MRKRAQTRTLPAVDSFVLDAGDESWFVYLFALTDCTAFKVGFSCNPLQRISTFSRRYFERFDLSQSVLLRVGQCELARALESMLKTELASARADAPIWVPIDAGGHTEWFSAVYFNDAETRLRSHERAHAMHAFDFFRAQLERASTSFESWALSEAQRACETWSCAQRGYAVRDRSVALRDWLDAYRYFDLPLFTDQPAVMDLVRQSARLSTS